MWGAILAVVCGAGVLGFSLGNEEEESAEQTVAADDMNKPHADDETEKNKDQKDVIQETQKKVVEIEQTNTSQDRQGSGFLYNDQGDVVTNAHVVAGAEEATIRTSDGQVYSGQVIGISNDEDVAVVRVKGLDDQKPLDMATEKADVGTEILTFGSPFGLKDTATTGIISGNDRNFELESYVYNEAYQISAPIAPGNSGGPLINSETGKVLGINSASTDEGSIGFSIPIVQVIDLIKGWSKSPMTSLPSHRDNGAVEEKDHEANDKKRAEDVVSYFYERVNAEDYEAAYSLLGNSWQSELSFEEFYNGYLETMSVTIDNMTTTSNGDTVEIAFNITAKEIADDGSTAYHHYHMTYQAGYENNRMTLLSGTGKMLQGP
ncbi:trypsin-like peptidase domain-containing protein [Barrientosiimonas marina]